MAPLHRHSIPRLELCSALPAVEIAETISNHLGLALKDFRFYCDSKVVVGYIYNNARRFHTYVTNRVARILSSTSSRQWSYVMTDNNPADQGRGRCDRRKCKTAHGLSVLLSLFLKCRNLRRHTNYTTQIQTTRFDASRLSKLMFTSWIDWVASDSPVSLDVSRSRKPSFSSKWWPDPCVSLRLIRIMIQRTHFYTFPAEECSKRVIS